MNLLYKRLDVKIDATQSQIQEQYENICKLLSERVAKQPSLSVQVGKRWQTIKCLEEAYLVLSNAVCRAAYDKDGSIPTFESHARLAEPQSV